MQVIYIDVLFFINLVMDTMIFLSVTLVINRRISFRRLMVAALMASVLYCLLVIIPILQQIPYGVYALWIPVIPVLYLFKPHTIKSFVKLWILNMVVAALYGGIIFNLWYLLGGAGQKIEGMHLGALIAMSIGVTSLFVIAFYDIRRRLIFPHFEYELEITYHEKQKKVLALLDTGNLLYTHGDHEPVIVVTYQSISSLLSEEENNQLKAFFSCPTRQLEAFLVENPPQRLISFQSVGCKDGLLWGMRVSKICFKIGPNLRVIPGCMLGISKNALCSDKHYEALLHPELMIEEEVVV